MEKPYLLVWVLVACSAFYTTQEDHLSRSGTAHSRLGLLTSIINEENSPTDLPTGQADEDGSLRFLLPR